MPTSIFDIIGTIQSSAAEERARRELEALRDEYGDIDLPEYEEMLLEQLGPSAFEGVRPDAQSVAAQRAALERLRTLSEGGPDAQFDADFYEAQSRANANESRQRAGILDRAASMGALTGGQAMAAQLAAQQGSANRLAADSRELAAERQRRAYQALRDSGAMAGQMRGQQWGEDAQRAQAADAIARQNAALRQQTHQYNQDLRSRRFDDAMRRQNARAGVTGDIAGSHRQQGQYAQQMGSQATGVASTIGQGLSGQMEYDQYGRRKGGG